MIDESVLRENDIRGVFGTQVTEDLAYRVGCSMGMYLNKLNKTKCIVGYDNRLSGEILVEKLMKGLVITGIDVIFIGMCTTPILNYATIKQNIEAGIMVTASHNPSNENGFKLFGKKFLHLNHIELEKVYELIKNNNYINKKGTIKYLDIKQDYINMLNTYINVGKRKLNIVIDPGNGTTSLVVHEIFESTNMNISYIFDNSDGKFPNHNPDPNDEKNLKWLIEKVKETKADFGLAFDGDGDRLGVVDEQGNIIECDKLMALFSRDIIPKTLNKKIIIDVKCSEALVEDIKNLHALPIMVKNGSAFIETELNTKDVLFGGEYSGHIFFRDKFYGFDDGIYGGLRLIEILSNNNKKISELLIGYKHYFNTPEIKVSTKDKIKFNIINKIKEEVIIKGYDFVDIDGIRVKFNDGWALIRCSNTGPNLTMRFESTTKNRLEEIKKEFTDLVNKYNK